MSRFIAKKVTLNTMKDCNQPGCGCFTKKGYYIQYRSDNVDSILFVCESCYDETFREKCSVGDFNEEIYIVKDNAPSYNSINPILKNLILWTRETIKTVRSALLIAAIILVTAFCIKEHPSIRNELSMPQLHAHINTEMHFASRDIAEISGRWESIVYHITNVFMVGGK